MDPDFYGAALVLHGVWILSKWKANKMMRAQRVSLYLACSITLMLIGHEVEGWLEPSWDLRAHPATWVYSLRWAIHGLITAKFFQS